MWLLKCSICFIQIIIIILFQLNFKFLILIQKPTEDSYYGNNNNADSHTIQQYTNIANAILTYNIIENKIHYLVKFFVHTHVSILPILYPVTC